MPPFSDFGAGPLLAVLPGDANAHSLPQDQHDAKSKKDGD
jgi:hypothetical protein